MRSAGLVGLLAAVVIVGACRGSGAPVSVREATPHGATAAVIAETAVATSPALATASAEPTVATITLGFVGDIMLDRRVEELMLSEGAGYPFEQVLPLFAGIDLLVGNLEGTFTDAGTPLDKYYVFGTDPALASGLASAGFVAVSLANNHATDYGIEGLERTLGALGDAGVLAFGAGLSEAEARAPRVLTGVGVPSIALLGYSTVGETIFAEGDRGGVAYATVEAIDEDVRRARERAEVVVVSLHSGVEYDHTPTDTQRTLARAAIDAGASVVVGHHPHVLQPWERYREGVIFYSLGNFVFDLDAEDLGTYGIGAFQGAVAIITIEAGQPIAVDFRPTMTDPAEHRPYPAMPEEATAIADVLFELGQE